MSIDPSDGSRAWRWLWLIAFAALALYVVARLGGFALTAEIGGQPGSIRLPNTFASVDHPFHVARADTLWRELASGRVLRWVGQHQGGYPVEFYPLGAAWLDVLIRGISLGSLSALGAHTLTVATLFLLPGLAYAALARIDRRPVVVGFLALVLHVSLPGSWYHGGYTELVQWGLVTNVAGAVAALLMLPALVRFLQAGDGRAAALAAALAAWAVYCNPRSIVGLAALALGAWAAVTTSRSASAGLAGGGGGGLAARSAALSVVRRLAAVVAVSALLAAPLLVALARFGGLYQFVRYSGYERVADYAEASVAAVSWPVLALGLIGLTLGISSRRRVATRAAAFSLVVYALFTAAVAFAPWVSRLVPQLEPTRLMPLQRFLVIYLAAAAIWAAVEWLMSRVASLPPWAAPAVTAALALVVLAVQTRPLAGPAPDPASNAVPPASLYPVAMSAQPQQLDLEVAVRAADEAAAPGTALLVLGSALAWHQQLWAPLWTTRPLFYDNWLWYWHPDHAGTPGYRFSAGHHYPDPEATIDREYLERHAIGAVVVTGPARETAARSPLLEPLRTGVYDAYAVRDPVTTVTFASANSALLAVGNQSIDAVAEAPGAPIVGRVNWYPRWRAWADGEPAPAERLDSGYLVARPRQPARTAELVYALQPLDWMARGMALAGVVGLVLMVSSRRQPVGSAPRWYARSSDRGGGSMGGA